MIHAVQEHDYEAARGLPEPLPAGETLLWQGSPDGMLLARRAFHLRKLALYFALLLAWRVASTLADGGGAGALARDLALTLPLAALGLGLTLLLAWMSARTTIYTLTDRRLVLRLGIVLTVTFNLPFARIESAALRLEPGDAQGHGDIAITLAAGERIAYLHLWPHARPWQLKRPQPLLRALPDAAAVALALCQALARHAGQDVAPPRPLPTGHRTSATPARALANAA